PRGKGLMIAIDILDNQGQPDPVKRDQILNDAFYQGLILLGCGKAAIRFCPSLVITTEQISVALNILHEVLKNYL
ncbi:MAG: aminotransferase class III-fold pyridoxal phosphate-dependent enzyme, partial [Xenococcus sp. (in: cyanobacteria)]